MSLTRAIWPSDGVEKLMRVCEKSWEVWHLEYQGSQAGDQEELMLQEKSEGSLLAELSLARGRSAFCSNEAFI